MTRGRMIVAWSAAAWMCGLASAASVSLNFTKPTNTATRTVTVQVSPGQDVSVPIPPGTSAVQKRNLIRDALVAAGYDVVDDGPGGAGLTIKHLKKDTKVTFLPGQTGEAKDAIKAASTKRGDIGFNGQFDPFGYDNQPAIFTAGIVTDLGELTVQVSAAELNFQTDGPIICQALFQRLAPFTPPMGGHVEFAGDRLEVYFDPAYTVTQGGVVFGTTSRSAGCWGAAPVPVNGQQPFGDAPESEPVVLQGVRDAVSTVELSATAPGADYCLYQIVYSADCPELTGKTICVECPSSGVCHNTKRFRIVSADGAVQCSGLWVRQHGSCTTCPETGVLGFRFRD